MFSWELRDRKEVITYIWKWKILIFFTQEHANIHLLYIVCWQPHSCHLTPVTCRHKKRNIKNWANQLGGWGVWMECFVHLIPFLILPLAWVESKGRSSFMDPQVSPGEGRLHSTLAGYFWLQAPELLTESCSYPAWGTVVQEEGVVPFPYFFLGISNGIRLNWWLICLCELLNYFKHCWLSINLHLQKKLWKLKL